MSANSFYFFSFHIAIHRSVVITDITSSTTANTSNTADAGTIADLHRDQQLSAASYTAHPVSPKMGPKVGYVNRPLPSIHKGKGREHLVSFQPASHESFGMLTRRKLSLQAPSAEKKVPQRLSKSGTRSKSRTTGDVGYKNSGQGRQAKLVANY